MYCGFFNRGKVCRRTTDLAVLNHPSTANCRWSIGKCKPECSLWTSQAWSYKPTHPAQTGLEPNIGPPERQDLQEEINSSGAMGSTMVPVTRMYQQANSSPILQISRTLAPADLTSLIKNGHEYFNKQCNPSCSGHNKETRSGKEALLLSCVPYCMCFTTGKHVLISYLSADCSVRLHSCC